MIEPSSNNAAGNAGSTVTPIGSKPAPIDPHDPARYTAQQEREMGVSDAGGRKIQPAASFMMIALAFVGVTAVAVVIVAIVMRFTGGPVGGQ